MLPLILVIAAGSHEAAGEQQALSSGYSGQGAPLFPEELQQLVAPSHSTQTRWLRRFLELRLSPIKLRPLTISYSRTRIFPAQL